MSVMNAIESLRTQAPEFLVGDPFVDEGDYEDEFGDYEDEGDVDDDADLFEDEGDYDEDEGDYDDDEGDPGDDVPLEGGPKSKKARLQKRKKWRARRALLRKRRAEKKSKVLKARTAMPRVSIPLRSSSKTTFIEVTDKASIINPPILPGSYCPLAALIQEVKNIHITTPYATYIATATPSGGTATITVLPTNIIAGAAAAAVPYIYVRLTANALTGNPGLTAPIVVTAYDTAGNVFVFVPLTVTKTAGAGMNPNFVLKLIPWRVLLASAQYSAISVTAAGPLSVVITGLSDTVHQVALIIPGFNHPDISSLIKGTFTTFRPAAQLEGR